MKLLIATHNQAKLKEIRFALKSLTKQDIELISLKDLKIKREPKEDGKTFAENSLLKAKFYSKLSGYPTIADDGGLTIDILRGEPGVHSRRWLGYEGTDQELIRHALHRLKGVPKKKRQAQLQTCITFYDPHKNKVLSDTESIKGIIADKSSQKATNGYPYRALFIVKKYNKYYDELTDTEHTKINHRFKLLKRLSKKISSYLLQ